MLLWGLSAEGEAVSLSTPEDRKAAVEALARCGLKAEIYEGDDGGWALTVWSRCVDEGTDSDGDWTCMEFPS